jgi:outer membrane cobalamin receptor
VLKPANVSEEVVVSAARSELKLSEMPGSMVRLSSADVVATPSLTVDDMLRQVPGFSLFRRSSSRTANPTSQGVSLRGLGASGPSRALVLQDGIPVMDPFGGWVHWNRIPPLEVSTVEVFRGGASNLYGSDAMGGVVQFFSREAEGPSLSLEASYGNEESPNVSLWVGDTIGKWNFEAATDLFRSDGYILVPSSQRGSIDTPANSKHAALDFGIGYRWRTYESNLLLSVRVASDDAGHTEATAEPAQPAPPPPKPRRPRPEPLWPPSPRFFWFWR